MDERVNDCETMRRENRRVAAMSWGAGDGASPPKPSRIQQTDSSPTLALDDDTFTNEDAVPQTYIVAQNATVLAQLMKENENRSFNYTTPASVFNTLAVDIKKPIQSGRSLLSPKTAMLPASELLKLNPIINNNSSEKSFFTTEIDKTENDIPYKTIKGLNSGTLPDSQVSPCKILDDSCKFFITLILLKLQKKNWVITRSILFSHIFEESTIKNSLFFKFWIILQSTKTTIKFTNTPAKFKE